MLAVLLLVALAVLTAVALAGVLHLPFWALALLIFFLGYVARAVIGGRIVV